MEEGSLRIDANVSVRPVGSSEFGTTVEIKNLNSLRSLVRAIEYEIERQSALIEAGERVVQETRHWDEDGGRTHLGALEGRGARLPLLPRARPRAGRARPTRCAPRVRAVDARAAGGARGPA